MGDPGRESVSEAQIHEIGAALLEQAGRSQPPAFNARGLRGRLLVQALRDEGMRAALFRFVDVLPQLARAPDVAAHFRAYLAGYPLGGLWGRVLSLGGSPLLAPAVRASVQRFAGSFLVEETPSALRKVHRQLQRLPAGISFDAVGEEVLTEAEAERYLERNLALLDRVDALGVRPPNLSIKLSALTPRFDPLDPGGTRTRVFERLDRLMPRVRALGATLTIDMEHHDFKPLVTECFLGLLERHAEADWTPAIAVQAYLNSAPEDLDRLIAAARRLGRRLCVRLVKGAYWDTEVALAEQRDWPVPVLLDKAATDAQFERLTAVLFAAQDAVYPAIASHNVRSLAHAIAQARNRGRTRADWEVQMLYGAAEPLAAAVAAAGVALRVYVPTGDLLSGIAYLIRRLVENTANTSILRQTWSEPTAPAVLLRAPAPLPVIAGENAAAPSNTPLLDFSDTGVRDAFAQALQAVRGKFGATYRIDLPGTIARPLADSVNPAGGSESLGRVEQAGVSEADLAVRRAAAAFDDWRCRPAAERIDLCRRAARLMREERLTLAAWEVFEAGKNWREADADVAEAIDFLTYYPAQMESLAGWHATRCYAGERNHQRYEARGVAAVIAPWNFPLAILTGMTTAALVTGNTVIMKPAAPTPIIAWHFADLLRRAGFPPDVVRWLPGPGATLGERLVAHPEVATVAFTGSRSVGLSILGRAGEMNSGQRQVKRVICEMGGKNAVVVDADADPDEAVRETLASAFGYQGQKCSAASRVIVVGESLRDRFIERLALALQAYRYGPPEQPGHVFGPVISAEAAARIEDMIAAGAQHARLYYRGEVPEDGFYVAPAIFSQVEPHMPIAREEIFGPVVAVLCARDFRHAIELANDSDYALTGGVFSRLPASIDHAREHFRVGNLYVNRRITGARVGVQPFGGFGHSGTGIQAGGPDYIKQFLWTRVVSENTLRHGYVPEE